VSNLTRRNRGVTLWCSGKDPEDNKLGRSWKRVTMDTGRVWVGTVAVGLALAALACSTAWAGDSTPSLRAKVVWVHGGKAYVASNDPLPLQVGDLVTFYDGKKLSASGKVSDVLDGTLAIARLTSGSLDVKKLDRLRLMSERPRLRPVDVMRIGIPSRSNLLFACGTSSVKSPLPRAAFRSETMSVRSFILSRDKSDPGTAQWPDTLLVRLFDEATDQEIALERGELDVAIFWPGELSTHMREDARWRDLTYGMRPRSVLTAMLSADAADPRFSPADTSALLSLNDEVFRGDLVPWDPSAGRATPVTAPGSNSARPPHRFEVDHSVPGWQALERSLRRKTASASPGSYAIRLALLGSQASPPDPAGFTFGIRCPVVCAPSLRTYVGTLGTDAFVNMVDCAVSRAGP